MAINVSKLIERVRSEITMDTDASDYRWDTPMMVDFVQQTAHELMRLRKHLLIDKNGAPSNSDNMVLDVTLEKVTNGTSTLPFPQRYVEPMMHGVAMRCFLLDSADQNNAARAQYERSRFIELASGTSTTTTSAS